MFIRLNVHEAKTHLSKYLEKIISSGQSILLCNRNVPVAEIRPLQTKSKKRVLGLAKGEFKVDANFNEPLPKDILNSFYK